MKILLVQETDWLEKGPLQQNHLMERLSLKGHEVRVIDHEIMWRSHNHKSWYSKRQVFNHISRVYDGADITAIRPGIIKIPLLDYISLLMSRWQEIRRQIREFNPDIIIGFQILTPFLALQAAHKHRLPFVYYWTDIYHSQIPFKLFPPLGRLIERIVLKGADRTISINEELRDITITMGARPQHTETIRGSVDLKRFSREDTASNIRANHGFKATDLVLCFVGMFHSCLALDKLIVQLSQVNRDDIKLLIVGESDQSAHYSLDELKELTKKHTAENSVKLVGGKPYHEVPAFMDAGDICILPAYKSEVMRHIVPIKVYEYMAMSKPVITTSLPGIIKEFGESNGVIYVDRPENIIEKAIEIKDNGQIKELGVKARNFVDRENWDSITNRFEAILIDLIKENRNVRHLSAGARMKE